MKKMRGKSKLQAFLYFLLKNIPFEKCYEFGNCCRPLFASSLLGIIRTLLEQSRFNEMMVLGCTTLVDFMNSQVGI